MTSYLIDINVWLAMTWEQHKQHRRAKEWFRSLEEVKLLFCRLTMLGFLRLLSQEKVMGESTLPLKEAFELYDRWLEDPRVLLAPEPRVVEDLFRQATSPYSLRPAPKMLADCYLVGFAEATNATIVTFDKNLASTARFRQVSVKLLHPISV